MAYEIVKCEIQYFAKINHWDSEMFVVDRIEELGPFDNQIAAEEALFKAGLRWENDVLSNWSGPWKTGKIEKVYKEIEND